MKRLGLLAIVIVAACGSFGAQAHTVSLAYKAGDTYKYGLHIVMKYTITAAGLSIPFNLDMSAKESIAVKSVDASGTADLGVAVSNMSLKTSINGTTNTTTTTTAQSLDMKVAKDGRIVSINGTAFDNTSFGGVSGVQGGLISAILPDKAVKPGDTWSKTFDQPNPFGVGSSQVTSNNTYLRDENNAAVIESKINGTLNMSIDPSALAGQSGTPVVPSTGAAGGVQSISIAGTSTSDVTSWIDLSAKRLVKTRSTGSVNATLTVNMAAGSTTPGLTGPVTFKGTQTLDLTPA
ncbi:MAG TPA: hypothetical protein VGX27_03895 [Candidatus Dormibacteraeota bacterium]|nr:hypothetical protein [Candidatus Dormibacteraeota bacterium]